MANSFFFYDLETSGISSKRDRIMQFGGQRTDLNLNPIGDPVNIPVKLSPDILPAPEAILVSGISPLENQVGGISEADFSKIFNQDIAIAGTIFVGFNNLRFDDEFIRYLNYRNFYDAYSWHWANDSSRWDMLDVVRMTRALRPDGIKWPFTDEGKPANKLELLTTANKLSHSNAHDALSDALATIDVARLIKGRQPKLFSYLLSLRKKSALIDLIKDNQALVYTSSHYPSEILHTTVVSVVNFDVSVGSALVFDLRHNPMDYIDLSVDELVALWEYDPDGPRPTLPLKTMKLNRCPAVAPLGVLDSEALKRLDLNMDQLNANLQALSGKKDELAAKLKQAIAKLDTKREQRLKMQPRVPLAEERLYDGFISKTDAVHFARAREAAKKEKGFETSFSDKRLNELYSLYRARNYPASLTDDEKSVWRGFVRNKLFTGEESLYLGLMNKIEVLSQEITDNRKLKLLADLKSYAQTIADGYEADLPV